MPQTVRLADLGSLTPQEYAAAIDRLIQDGRAPTNGQALATLTRIRAFESQYEVSSSRLLEELRSGSRKETAEISEWLFLLSLYRRVTGGG